MIHDVKPPLDVPSYEIWIVIILAIFLLAAVCYFFLKRRRVQSKPVIQPPSWEKALKALASLEASRFLRDGRFKEFYSELSHIIRRYFEERFHDNAPEMTTEEFLVSLKYSDHLKRGNLLIQAKQKVAFPALLQNEQ